MPSPNAAAAEGNRNSNDSFNNEETRWGIMDVPS